MKLLVFATVVLLSLVATLPAAEPPSTYADLVRAAPLPAGYGIASNDINIEGKKRGSLLLLSKAGAVGKVIITIEDRELPTPGHRLAAYKAYINTNARAILQQGFRLTEHDPADFKDLEKLKFNDPVTVKLTFKDQDGNPLYMNVRGLFTKIGYSVIVVANNKDDLKMLSEWAATVNEK